MTVSELSKIDELKVVCMPSPDRVVDGAYVGDLLSWVMGRAKEANAWITIMSNQNVIAVASLADVSCVILAEGTVPDDALCALANDKEINLIKSELPIYETAKKLFSVLK